MGAPPIHAVKTSLVVESKFQKLEQTMVFQNLILLTYNLLLLNEGLVYILRTIYLGFEFFLYLLILLRSTLWIYIKSLQLHFIFQALLLTNNQISLL